MSDAGFGGYAALLAAPPRTRVVLSGLIARAPIAGAVTFGDLGSVPLLILFSVVCGITVAPVGAFMRARWSALVQDQRLLRTAFAIEAVADEVVWVFGPAVAALLASSVVTSGGLVLSGILGPAGAIFLRLMPEPANTDHAEPAHEPFRLLRSAPFIVLLLMSFATGLCFGINGLTVISMATSDGVPALAGTVLTAYSVGSASGGIIFGAISPRFRSTPMLVGTCAACC